MKNFKLSKFNSSSVRKIITSKVLTKEKSDRVSKALGYDNGRNAETHFKLQDSGTFTVESGKSINGLIELIRW